MRPTKGMKQVRTWRTSLAAASAAALLASTGVGPVAAEEDHDHGHGHGHEIFLEERRFTPRVEVIGVGESVTWVHEDPGEFHSVTADDGSFDSNPGCSVQDTRRCLRAGGVYRHTFEEVGRFPYHSKPHGGPGGKGMAGVVIVVPHEEEPEPGTIAIRDGAFFPAEEVVEPGGTVTWVHEDGSAPHSVTADDGSFDSHPDCRAGAPGRCMQEGERFRFTFDTPGRYAFHSRPAGAPGGAGASGILWVRDRH